MEEIIQKIRAELINNIDEKYLISIDRFFKEKHKDYGVRTPIVRKIAKRFYKDVKNYSKYKKNNSTEDGLKLSHILNVFDGLLEMPGRIIIITTNHPEKIDEALLRPGRIDRKIEFKKCTDNILKKITQQLKDDDLSVGKYLKKIKPYLNAEHRELIIKAMYHVAASDGHLDDKEGALLMDTAKVMEMTAAHIKGVLAELDQKKNDN